MSPEDVKKSDPVALGRRDRVFIRKRAGFIKYALQHGYNLQPAFTFGESDIYASLQHPLYRRLCLFTLKHAGFVIPVFWGPRWYCPLLPRDGSQSWQPSASRLGCCATARRDRAWRK